MQVLHLGGIGPWRSFFCGRKKTEKPAERPSEQGKSKYQTRLTYGNGSESKPGQIGGRRFLTSMRYATLEVGMIRLLNATNWVFGHVRQLWCDVSSPPE